MGLSREPIRKVLSPAPQNIQEKSRQTVKKKQTKKGRDQLGTILPDLVNFYFYFLIYLKHNPSLATGSFKNFEKN